MELQPKNKIISGIAKQINGLSPFALNPTPMDIVATIFAASALAGLTYLAIKGVKDDIKRGKHLKDPYGNSKNSRR